MASGSIRPGTGQGLHSRCLKYDSRSFPFNTDANSSKTSPGLITIEDSPNVEKAELPAQANLAKPKKMRHYGRHELNGLSPNMEIILKTKELPATPLTPEDSPTDSAHPLNGMSPRSFPFGGRHIASKYSVQEAP